MQSILKVVQLLHQFRDLYRRAIVKCRYSQPTAAIKASTAMRKVEHQYRRNRSSVSLLLYHFIFSTKYRRKLLTSGPVEDRLKELIAQVCKELDVNIIAMEVVPDHVHLLVEAPPTLSPSQIMHRVKGPTSRRLRQEFLGQLLAAKGQKYL
jgi:REP element-mobilizing transposase RayT